MKFFHTFIMICMGAMILNAQENPVPNGNFENWDNEFSPKLWNSKHDGSWYPVSTTFRSAEAQEGSFAVRMEVNYGLNEILLPLLSSRFQLNQTYESVSGFYRFQPDSVTNNAVLKITVDTYSNGVLISKSIRRIEEAAEVYTPFSFNIEGTGDEMMIQFEILSNSTTDPGVGSFAIIDQVRLGRLPTTDIQDGKVPFSYSLKQNYPNPFNPSTKISYSVPVNSGVRIIIYDALGREIKVLVNEENPAGSYEIDWNAANVPSGIYFYEIQAGEFMETRKMMLMK